MKHVAEPLFTVRVRGLVSSSPLLADVNGDGSPEVFVGGPVLSGLTWCGERLPRWPRKAQKPIASSPAFGDINGDGRGEIVVGCDDGHVLAFFADGDPVPGWPVKTNRDVFSTPALTDMDGDKALEAFVGSDDGRVYAIRGTGETIWASSIPGNPFVSASPTVVPSDGGGRPDIVVGAWDRHLHRFSAEGRHAGTLRPPAGGVIWSSSTSFAIAEAGAFLAWAADRAYVSGPDGRLAPGWPRRMGSWAISSPAVVELDDGEGATIVVGAERLYAWDLAGDLRAGFPVDAGDFLWSSPIAFDLDGDGAREVVVGSWDGGIYAFRSDGALVEGFPLRTGGPIFATPAAAPLPDGGGLLVAASWDGTVRGWHLRSARFRRGDWLQFRGGPDRRGLQTTVFPPLRQTPAMEEEVTELPRLTGARVEPWAGMPGMARVVVGGFALTAARNLMIHYAITGERRMHQVPAVNSRGRFVALIQPLRVPHLVRFFVEAEDRDGRTQRWPEKGHVSFLARPRIAAGLFSGGFARAKESMSPTARISAETAERTHS